MELDKALKKSPYHCAQIDNDGDVVTVEVKSGFIKVTTGDGEVEEVDSLEELNDILEEHDLPPDRWYWMGQK